MTPEDIVKNQVIAYNTRDVDSFVLCHHPKAELYNFSEKIPFAKGRQEIRTIYKDIFDNSPNLNTKVTQRIVLGNTVIDNEIVTGRKGVNALKIIAIYEVREQLIFKAHFIRE